MLISILSLDPDPQQVVYLQLAAGNAEAIEALQSRLDSLQTVLLPVYATQSVDIPDDVRKGVRDLAV